MLHNRYTLALCLVMLLALTGCKVSKPKEVLTESQLEELLYDYHIARAMSDNLPYNESYKKRLFMDYVFEKHHTTEAIFDSSMVWYTRHADVLSKVYERVNTRLKAEQNELDDIIAIRERKPKTSAPGDSIELWFLRPLYRLDSSPFNNLLTFTVPSDSNFKDKDTLLWSVYYHFPGQLTDSAEMAIMSMSVQYNNDSIISEIRRIIEPGMQQIRLQADSIGAIKEVRGYIYYTRAADSLNRYLFADSISLMRYHTNDSIYALLHDTVPANEHLEDSVKVEKQDEPEETPEAEQLQIQERLTPEEMRDRRNRPQQQLSPANVSPDMNQLQPAPIKKP